MASLKKAIGGAQLCRRCGHARATTPTANGTRVLAHLCPHDLPCQKTPGSKTGEPTCLECAAVGKPAPGDVNAEAIARMLCVHPPGTRVRAVLAIYYAHRPIAIPVGALGTVIRGDTWARRVTGMSVVHWDNIAGGWATTNEAIEARGDRGKLVDVRVHSKKGGAS